MGYFVRSDGYPKLPLIALLIANITNIIISLILMGVFDLGVAGSSLGSVIGYALGSVYISTYFFKENRSFYLTTKIKVRQIFSTLKEFLMNTPEIISRIFITVKVLFYTVLCSEYIGIAGLMAFLVYDNSETVVYMFLSAIAKVMSPIVTVFYYFLIETVFLDFNINRRAKEMENAAISYFPVFLISLRCSRSVKKSLDVTNKIVKNKLSYEFDKVLNDVTIGKSLQEALEMCIERMPSEIIVNILVSLIEADRLGNNIDKTVSIQLDYLKEVNKKKLLHNYSLISIRLVFVFCFFMLIFLGALMAITYILSMI
jgi:hypothetical protein